MFLTMATMAGKGASPLPEEQQRQCSTLPGNVHKNPLLSHSSQLAGATMAGHIPDCLVTGGSRSCCASWTAVCGWAGAQAFCRKRQPPAG